jgi:hypothetical protein
MRDDNSLAAAGYVEEQFLVLVVTASHAPAPASAPLAVSTYSNPRFMLSQQKIQAVPRTAASATSLPASCVVNCASGHVCQMHTYQSVHRKCSICSAHIENLSIGARCNTCNYDVCHECVSKSRTPTIDHSTEWLDELGCVCPKAVDYASQCPKGHALVPFAGGGCGALAGRVICRSCHTFAESEQPPQWLVCSVTGCCAGYAVCSSCVSALHHAPAAVAAGEGFSFQVNILAAAARHFG